MKNMFYECDISRQGSAMAEQVGKMLVEDMTAPENEKRVENVQMLESMGFKEDNTMANSGDLYTTVLGKKIFYNAYDKFNQYFEAVLNLTPADLGMPEGAGAYKIPKIESSPAAKLADGEVVQYLNDGKASVTLETETFGIGTSITRRLIKRGAKGFIKMLVQAGSDSVLMSVATEIANDMVAGADSGNTVTGGISYDKIEDAKLKIKKAANSSSQLYGFRADVACYTAEGMNLLLKNTDFKNVMYRNTVPGSNTMNTEFVVWQGLKVLDFDLITVQKGGADVHAIIADSKKFVAFLKETGMDTYDGRLPGKAGDIEIIQAIDAGAVALNTKAGAVITA